MTSGELQIPVNTQNRDPRITCAILLDTSYSMSEYITDLEKGLKIFIDEIQNDPLARKRADVGIITFNTEATLISPFQEARSLSPTSLHVNGTTNMAAAINLALDEIENRKNEYRVEGLEYFRPWLFILTDGAPDREGFDAALKRLNDTEARKGVSVFGVGVGNEVDWEILNKVSTERVAVHMNGIAFGEMFRWLSASLSSVSNSSNFGASDTEIANQNQQIALPSPQGWAVV